MAESYLEKRRRELGIQTPTSFQSAAPKPKKETSTSSFVEKRKQELGITNAPAPVIPTPSVDVRQSPVMQQVQAAAPQSPAFTDVTPTPIDVRRSPEPKPGRDIPVVGAVLRGLDWLAKPSQAIAEYTTPDAPMIGKDGKPIPGTNAREAFLERTGAQPATGAMKVLGQVAAPFAVPGAGLGAGINLYRGAGQALAPVTSRFGQGLGGRVAQEAVKEAAVGVPMAAGIELSQGRSNLQDASVQGAIGGAAGAALGAAAPLVGAGVRQAAQSLRSRQAGNELLRTIEQTPLPMDLSARNVRQLDGSASPEPTVPARSESPTPLPPATSKPDIEPLGISAANKQNVGNAKSQDLFSRLFGQRGVGIAAGAKDAQELIDTHITDRAVKQAPLRDRVRGTTEKAEQEIIDQFAPFRDVSPEAYNAAMDSTRANNLANVTISDKFVDLEGNVLGDSLRDVFSTVPRGQQNIANRYLVMRDAVDRMARGQNVYADHPSMPQTAQAAESMVRQLEARFPWLQEVGQRFNQFNRNRQDLWVNSGIASPQMVERLRASNPNYAPMFRQMDETSRSGRLGLNTSKQGFSNQTAPVKRATGSRRKIVDPVQGMIETTGSSYNAMMRNRAMQKVYEAVQANPERYRGLIEIVEETVDAKQSTIKALNEAMQEGGLEGVADYLNREAGEMYKKGKQAAAGTNHHVTVLIDGNPVKMKVSDLSLLRAIEGMAPEQLDSITRVFDAISRGIKYAATGGAAPLQGARLAFRDLPIAFFQSKDKLRFPLDISRAFISQIADWLPHYIPGAERLGNLARQYYRAGGGYEAYLKGDSRLRAKSADITRDPILSGRNMTKMVRRYNPFRPLKGFGDALENIPRIAAFNAEMRRTGWDRSEENVRRAVDAGREATVNWSRRGATGRKIESFLPYSNAAVQGTYRFVKRLKEQPISAIALIMTMTAAKIAAFEKFKDDPDFQQRSRFEKGIPYAKTADGKFRVLPVEPTEAFIADQILEFYKWATNQSDEVNVKERIQEGADAFLPKYASGPISAFTSPGKAVDAPSAIANLSGGSSFEPISAITTGKNFFGGDIIPREYQGLPTNLQYNETTSRAGQWAAENLGIDAFTFDYLAQRFGGDLAKVALPMTSEVGKGDPAGNVWDETLTRLKLLEDPVMKNRIADDYFNRAQAVSQAKLAYDRNNIPLPDWYDSAYAEVTSTRKDSISSRVSELNKIKKEIQRDTMLTAKQRADELRNIQSEINLLRLEGIKRMEELGVPKMK